MTAPHFATVPDVEPVVELGTGQTFADTQGGRWDVAHWDQTDAHWSGSEPSWVDVTCDVRAVDSTVGHDRTLDAWDVGTATVTVDNSSGWADLTLDPLNPATLDLRPGRAIRWGIRHTVPGFTIPGTPQVDGWLTPSVGIASTPDPGPLPGTDCVLICTVQQPVGAYSGDRHVVSQDDPSSRSWDVFRHSDGAWYVLIRYNAATNAVTVRTTDAATPITGGTEVFAFAVSYAVPNITVRTYRPNGTGGWALVGNPQTAGMPSPPFDGVAPVRIGAHYGDYVSERWNGRVYSAELRTGSNPAAGTTVWRFDANDYPGTGTTYVDPRGRTWTLTNATAITPKIPAGPDVVVPDTLETTWRFRGYIDAMRATYEGPHAETDTSILDCIDALGEVARVNLAKLAAPVGDGETVNARLHRILDAVGWRTEWRDIAASNIPVFGTDLGAQAADLLGATADTAAGAVFGDYDGQVAFRNRDWQTWLPDAPPDLVLGNTTAATVCPSTIEVAFPRAGTTTRSLVNWQGNDGPPVQRDDTEAQLLYGVETAPERLDLQTNDPTQLDVLADRLLETRGVATMPRVTALTLDAGRDTATMLACLDADPQRPSRWRLVIERDGRTVLDRMLLVTSVSHSWDAGGWHTSVRLDDAMPWAAAGGRWDGSYWDAATWSAGTGLVARLEDLLEALEGVS